MSPRHPPQLSDSRAPWLGLALVLVALPGAWFAPQVFFASWLAASWFGLGLVLGALAWLWIHRLTGGRWGIALRPHILRLAARLPRVLLLSLPLVAGASRLYPWLSDLDIAGSDAPLGDAFISAWHAPPFFAARCAVYAAVWLLLAWRARSLQRAGEAALSVVLHMAFTSLAAVDLLAALVPRWSSSAFGLVALAAQGCGGGAFVVALACRELRLASAQPTTGDVPLTRDFGNLLLTAVLTWAYVAFMQLLIIWAENLPREISWFVPRLQSDWLWGGVALLLLHFALPLVLLLFRAVKDAPRRLEWLALALVGANAFDAVWLVLPSVAPHALSAWWLAPCLMLGLTLLSFGGTTSQRRRAGSTAQSAAEEFGHVRT